MQKHIIAALLLVILVGCAQYGRPIDIPADVVQTVDVAVPTHTELPPPTSLFLQDAITPQQKLTQLPNIYTPSTYNNKAQALQQAILQQICGNQQVCPQLYNVQVQTDVADQNVLEVERAVQPNVAQIAGAQVVIPRPDLIIESIAYQPTTPSIGDTVTFTITIKNNGSTSAASTTARLFHDGSGVTTPTIPALAAGETHTFSHSLQPGGGNHNIRAVVDVQDVVVELDEGNNELSIDYQVAAVIALQADLIIDRISHTPLNPRTGDDVQITGSIKNHGGQSSVTSNTHIIYNGGLVASMTTPAIPPGSTEDVTYTLQNIPVGQHTITINADAQDQVPEQDETNNNDTISITVGQEPDYKPTLIVPPQTITPGIAVPVNFTIFNIGPAPSPQTTFDIYVDTTKISTRTLPPLISGIRALPAVHHHTEMLTFTGTHTVRIVVDPQNTIAETNEANNELTATIQTSTGTYISPKILPPTLNPVSGYAIGTCQNNALVAQLLGNAQCAALQTGDGIIKQYNYRGKWIIVLAGATHTDVRNAVDLYINLKQLGPQSIAREFIFRKPPTQYTLTLYAKYQNTAGQTKHLMHYTLLGDPTTVISLPLQPVQNNIANVFGGTLANIDAIYSFDEQARRWKIYRQGAPSDLSMITSNTGYFILMNTQQNVPLKINDVDESGASRTINTGPALFSPPEPSLPQDYNFIDTTKPILCQSIASRARGWLFSALPAGTQMEIGQVCWITSTGGTI